jgi:hypothetical protein
MAFEGIASSHYFRDAITGGISRHYSHEKLRDFKKRLGWATVRRFHSAWFA